MSILGFSSCWRRRGIVELHMACFRGHDGVVAVLLGHGADADRAGKLLWTPLHYACYWRRRGIVEALLEHGACPNKRNAQGSTPLHVASKDPGLAALLLAHGADARLLDNKGTKAGCFAAAPNGGEKPNRHHPPLITIS